MTELATLQKSHVVSLAYALSRAYANPPWNEVWTLEQAQKCIEHTAFQSDSVGYVILENGVAVGAAIGKLQHYREPEFFLNQIFIHPDYQGKGYGKKLLDHLEHELKKQGVTGIELVSISGDQAFYEACGYTVTDWLCISRHFDNSRICTEEKQHG